MVERGGVKIMHALDIGAGSLELVHGHAPDRAGEICFDYRIKGGHGGATIYGACSVMLSWPRGGVYVVSPQQPRAFQSTARVSLPASDRHPSDGGYYDRLIIPYSVPTGARPAADDVLKFGRSGAILEVPAGLGDGVYREILSELERGSARAA